MTAATPSYQMTPLSGVLKHAARKFWLLRDVDIDEPIEQQRLHAQIKSGDYFHVLVSDLDEISQNIAKLDEAQSITLQHLIDNLLYIDRHYQLRAKP